MRLRVRAAYYYPGHGGCYHHTRDSDGASHALRSDTWWSSHVTRARVWRLNITKKMRVRASHDAEWRTFIIWRTLVFRIFWHGTQVLVTKLLQVLQPFVSSPNGDKTAHLFLLWNSLCRARGERGQKLDKTRGVRLVFVYLEHLETRLKTRFNWPRRIASLFCPLLFAYSRHKKWNWCSRDKV